MPYRICKTIDIENAYFLNVPGLNQLLHAALMRGVEVRILTNSKTSVDEPLLSEPIMKSLPDLVESGRSEEHTSELQSPVEHVVRCLL